MKKDQASPKVAPEAVPAQEAVQDKKKSGSQALKKAQEELAAANDKYLRLYSEFENFRRRATKEKFLLIESAGERVLKRLLPIVDDFERALEALQSTNATAHAMQEGIRLIYEKLLHLLQQEEVQPMPLEKGASFDAELHEAVTQMPAETPEMQGKVLDVLEKGYLLKEKVLRFAKVVTGA
ncbi:MAG: nucleotide exchange factor GrpE [Bacteroidota bacterium]